LFAVVVLGTIYNISDLTEWSNRKYFDRVNQNLTIRLTEPFKNDPEVPKNLTWSKVRLVFYKIVDSDESLKVKAKLAYRNGAFWTSVADLRVISAIGCVVFLCLPIAPYLIQNAKFESWRALLISALLLIPFALSFPISDRLTTRHMEIGNEQVDHILAYHKKDLRDGLIWVGA
jgi:hypothetical protein